MGIAITPWPLGNMVTLVKKPHVVYICTVLGVAMTLAIWPMFNMYALYSDKIGGNSL